MIDEKKLIEDMKNTSLDVELWTSMKPHEIVSATIEAYLDHAIKIINSQPPADQWIPVTYHETTEEEKEVYGMTCPYILDCPLPEEGDEILVCSKNGKVFEDLMCYDDGWYLDGGYDFVEEITAWMPLPEPYKGEQND